MAYFAWKGVDLTGSIKRGASGARSMADLHDYLLQQDIALLHAKPKRRLTWFTAITLEQKNNFFKSLAELVETGVRMPQAIELLARQEKGAMQEILFAIAEHVQNGGSLSAALLQHPHVFDSFMVHTVVVGQESGNLVAALTMLSKYLELAIVSKKKIRTALLMPLCTLAFFCMVAVFIFVCVIPRLATLFTTTGAALPYTTRIVLSMSAMLCNTMFVGSFFLAIIGLYCLLRLLLRREHVRLCADTLLLRLPFIGPVYMLHATNSFMQSFSLMMANGSTVLMALRYATAGVTNHNMRRVLEKVCDAVQHGSSLSSALYMHHSLFDAELLTVVQVGEQSGRLSALLTKSAMLYHTRLQTKIDTLITVVQPILIIFLGLLISGLIIAVYMPVFNLPHILSTR